MNSLTLTRFPIFVLAAVMIPLGHAQYIQIGSKLVGTGSLRAGASEGSATALSHDGNTAVIGATTDNAFWVFARNSGVWSQQGARLSGSGGSPAAGQGWSVAISGDGNTLIVGGPFDSAAVGASWIFVRGAGGAWTQQGGKLTANDSVGGAEQGYAVALSNDGNTALVGGVLDAGGLGATWVYTRNGNGVWTQQGAKLVGTGAAGGSWQGNGVALSADGNTAITGAPFDANFLGASWVFTRDANGVWAQQGPKLVGNGSLGASLQGQSVSLSADGTTALIGGPFDRNDQSGAAWVFTRNGSGTWGQQGSKLAAADLSTSAQFGESVSLSADGNTAVLGGPTDGPAEGAVWVFTRTNGVWNQQGNKLMGTGSSAVGTSQGQSVSISGDASTILFGGPHDNNTLGAAWVFEQVHLGFSTPANTTAGVPFNFSVNLLQPDNTPFAGTSGVAHFTSSDLLAVLPADSTLTSTAILAATLKTPGNQTITVTDVARPALTGTSSNIAVAAAGPSPATHFNVTAPATATKGVAINPITVTALDAANHIATGYAGTVHFSSTDGAATLPANAALANGVGTFTTTLNTVGNQTITATDVGTGSITGTSGGIAVGAAGIAPPSPDSISPASGNNTGASLVFSFSDPRGAQDLGVLNILINRFLDGRNACYLAYSQPLNTLYLVDDNGAISPQIPGAVLNSGGSVANSQCVVSWAASAVAKSGNGLNLALTINFKPAFTGNMVIFMAARDIAENNSGWQALRVWHVPGGTQTSTTAAAGNSIPRGAGMGPTNFTFTFSDTNGFADLGVENVLINDFIDGRRACYLAYSRPLNTLYLVNDNGDALLTGQSLASAGSASNSQCTVSWGANPAIAAANNLSLTLNFQFRASFAGNRVIYVAARDVNEANNTDWQALGSWTVAQ